MNSRRTFLAVSASALIPFAGCTGSIAGSSTLEPTSTERPDTDYDGVPDEEDGYPDNYVAAQQVMDVSERVVIPPTEYKTYPINAERDGMIKYDMIAEGGPIDLLFVDRENYDKWQKGKDDAEYRTVLSDINTASSNTAQLLPSGRYVIVLDHTGAQTPPNPDEVTVNFSLEVAIESEENASSDG